MIARVYTGYTPSGLLRYLFGPGRECEHVAPRVVATWDQRPQRWQPEHSGPGEHDFDLAALTAALQAPAYAAGLPVTPPDPVKRAHRRFFRTEPDGTRRLRNGYVWHCTLRNHRDDPTLSDADWAEIAEEVMHRAGLARHGDPDAPRWIAVRHDTDGIHLVATLVRQDTARRVHPSFDKRRLREAAREAEQRYGLTATAPADGTAASAPARGEREKTLRRGERVPARVELRAAVAQAAAQCLTVPAFVDALEQAGYDVQLRKPPSGEVQGYCVSRPGDVNADGCPVWYSGSTLARDLSLPKLAARWAQARRGRVPERGRDEPGMTGHAWAAYGADLLDRTHAVLRTDPGQVHGIAHAVGEVFTVLDGQQGHPLSSPSARWDRVARAPYQPVPPTQQVADELRWLARGLSSTGVPSVAAMQLGTALAALAVQIAAVLQDSGRPRQQVLAARQAAHGARQAASTQPPQSKSPHPQGGQDRPARPRRRFTPPPPAPPGHGRPPSPPQRGR